MNRHIAARLDAEMAASRAKTPPHAAPAKHAASSCAECLEEALAHHKAGDHQKAKSAALRAANGLHKLAGASAPDAADAVGDHEFR